MKIQLDLGGKTMEIQHLGPYKDQPGAVIAATGPT